MDRPPDHRPSAGEPGDGVVFTVPFEVRRADLDGNRHVRNTAFSEYATHTRFRLLAAHGSVRRGWRRCASGR